MRLGQLARKLDEKPTKILDFLKEEHGIEIEDTLNSKLDDEIIEMITSHFKPELTENKVEEVEAIQEIIEENELEPEVLEKNQVDVIIEEEVSNERIIVETETDEVIELLIEDGVIKAPKKELEGPKVLGKIELPSGPPKLEFIVTSNNITQNVTEHVDNLRNALKQKSEKAVQPRSNQTQNKNRLSSKSTHKSKKDDISLDELKRKEREEFEKRKKERERKQKEKKAKHYQENVLKKIEKSNSSNTKKKKKSQSLSQSEKKSQKPEPTTKLGKIWRWFNT